MIITVVPNGPICNPTTDVCSSLTNVKYTGTICNRYRELLSKDGEFVKKCERCLMHNKSSKDKT